ncbi:hypothetical protein B6U74_03520 [Candidatus Bathyarchaeota archaeon ex4484_205]|nr:MAG: hypothetical protein B6U74_03520 [Candidatus Bathyarchaeota archaeon ex4484_205]
MVTNLPPQAEAQYKKVLESRSPEEKLRNLQLYLSMIPKHKGTEKLRMRVKRQIAALQTEIERKRKKSKRKPPPFLRKGESELLISLFGVTLSGKSTLLARLTNTKPKITGLPYTTLSPQVGTSKYAGVYFKFIEVPAYIPQNPLTSLQLDALNSSDLIIFLVDSNNELLPQLSFIEKCEEYGIFFSTPPGPAQENTKFPDLEAAIRPGSKVKPLILLLNLKNLDKNYQDIIKSKFRNFFPVYSISVKEDPLSFLYKAILNAGEWVRIFTKPIGGPPSKKPILLKKGSTVRDVAARIHRDFLSMFKYAKLWREGKIFRVGLDFKVKDGDIVEIRLK